jgi:hypothetical protein
VVAHSNRGHSSVAQLSELLWVAEVEYSVSIAGDPLLA